MDRWKIWAVAGWSLLGVALLAGAGDKGELRLRRLVIEDERGRDRIVLGVEGDEASVGVLDERGDPRARLDASREASGLQLNFYRHGSVSGKPSRKAILSVGNFLAPRLHIYDGEAPTKKPMEGVAFPPLAPRE